MGQGDIRDAEEEDQPKQRIMKAHKELGYFVTIKSKQYCEGFFFPEKKPVKAWAAVHLEKSINGAMVGFCGMFWYASESPF